MKTTYLYGLTALAAALTLSSCEDMFGDFLDKQASNELTEDDVFGDWANVEQFHYDTYNFLRHGAARIGDSWLDAATDLAETSFATGGVRTTFNIGNYYGGGDELEGTWESRYRGIRKCNMIINRMANVPRALDISEEKFTADTARVVAEAHFFRAYFYWELFLRYGAVPIVTEVLDPDGDLLTGYTERPTLKAFVVDFILNELKKCEANLYTYDEAWDKKNAGRVSQPAARALRSRIMLYMASPRYAKESGITWAEAAEVSKSFIDDFGSNFELVNEGSDGVSAYTNAWLRTTYTGENKEIIFFRNDGTISWGNISVDTPVGEGGRGGNCPSQNLVDMYDMIDGSSPFTEYDATGAPVYDANGNPTINTASGYTDANMWENRDGRLFFNVTEKLADDETMDISTSTMVVGIRGTSGWVDADNSDLYIGDGTLHVTGINPKTGEKIEAEFTAGQKVHVYLLDDQGKTVAFELENYTIRDVPREMLRNIVQYPTLFERFVEETEFDPKEVIREAIVKKILPGDMVLSEEYEGLVDEVLEEMKEAEEEEEVEEEETEEVAEEEPETTPPRRNQQQQEEPPAEEPPAAQPPAAQPQAQQPSASETTNTDETATPNEPTGEETPDEETPDEETTDEETTNEETTNEETTDEETTPTSYTVTVSQAEGGSASASASSAEEGTAITLTATADYGYEFSGWTVSEGGVTVTDNGFTMPAANVTVAPQFTALPTRTATVRWYWSESGEDHWGTASLSSAGGATASTSNPSAGDYYASATITAVVGDTITAAVSPLDGYVFSKWLDISGTDIDQQTAPAEFVMPDADVVFTAWFVPSDPVSFSIQFYGPDRVDLPEGVHATYGNGIAYTSGTIINTNRGVEFTFTLPSGYRVIGIDEEYAYFVSQTEDGSQIRVVTDDLGEQGPSAIVYISNE